MHIESPDILAGIVCLSILNYVLPPIYRWLLLGLTSLGLYLMLSPTLTPAVVMGCLVAGTFLLVTWGYRMGGRALQTSAYAVIGLNLAVLCAFKLGGILGQSAEPGSAPAVWGKAAQLAMPLGISFITFKLMSYAVDVSRGQLKPEGNGGLFLTYGFFFPQVTAGPIQRAQELLPQLRQPAQWDFERYTDGLKLILWGMFKKLVVADRLAGYVGQVYDQAGDVGGMAYLVASYCYATQIYCDFSGYTDMAIGIGRLFGLTFPENFQAPYTATSIGDFWRRWHMTLSSWLRDYLYIPLGGNRVVPWRYAANVLIVFLLCGLWHGVGGTFLVWGGLHGLYLIAARVTQKARERMRCAFRLSGSFGVWVQQCVTFHLVTFAWIFFRAKDLSSGLHVIQEIGSSRVVDAGWLAQRATEWEFVVASIAALVVFVMEGRIGSSLAIERINGCPVPIRWAAIYGLIGTIAFFGVTDRQDFIYSQF